MDVLTQAAWMYTVASTQPLYAYVSSATRNHVCGGTRGQPQVLLVSGHTHCVLLHEMGFLAISPAWNSPVKLDWLDNTLQGSPRLHVPRAGISGVTTTPSFFYVGSGDRTRGLVLLRQGH